MSAFKSGKILFVGDLHLGVYGSSVEYVSEFQRWFDDFLLPTIAEQDPASIVFLGDIFDDRVKINVMIMNLARRCFVRLGELGIPIFVVIGNHDVPLRSTIVPNSVEPILGDIQNVNIVTDPTDLKIGDVHLLMVPWICHDNEDQVWLAIDSSEAQYLAGHFDIVGFETAPGILSTHGIDHTDFSKFKTVYSGHYHTWSKKHNIVYCGAPYQLTRSDVGQKKRLWTLSQDGTTSWIEYDRVKFIKIVMNDNGIDGESSDGWFDDRDVKGMNVSVVVSDGVTDDTLRAFVSSLEYFGATSVKVVDARAIQERDAQVVVDASAFGFRPLLMRHIEESVDYTKFDRESLKNFASDVLNESGL